MKAIVKVQNKNAVPSSVLGEDPGISLNLVFSDPDEAAKAGFKRQTSITLTVADEASYPMHSEHTIEIRPVK